MLQLCDCVSKITLHTVMHHTMFRCDTSGFLLWPFLWPDMTWPYVTQVPPPKQRFQAPRSYPDAPTSAVSWRSPAHFVEDWVHHGASMAPKTVVHGGQSGFRCRILLGFCCLLRFIHALLRIQCAKSEANDKPWSWQDDLAEVDLGFHNNMFLVFSTS